MSDDIPDVDGFLNMGKTILAECPYCGEDHKHQYIGEKDDLIRTSNCIPGGRYRINLSDSERDELDRRM